MEFSRRRFLLVGLAGAAAACSSDEPEALPADSASASSSATNPSSSSSTSSSSTTTTTEPPRGPIPAPDHTGEDPFVLGIASGDPDAASLVLWTRLITDADTFEVAVDVAEDREFTKLVHSEIHPAPADHGRSVHAVIENLAPDRWYHYRFRVGGYTSPVGRTRTMPAAGTSTVRFGFSSCQNWESGTFVAHRHLAEAQLDFFVWLGDYIYEYGPNDRGVVSGGRPRVHDGPEITDLDSYRNRYALYRSDPALQAHHAAHPWFVTWDDHEVDNNHAGVATEDGQDREAFVQRRDAAYQAWWEHMPVRVDPPVPGEPFVIYRTASWGDLLDLHVLDGRQFRDPQPVDGELVEVGGFALRTLGPTALRADHTMLGAAQRSWLLETTASSDRRWTALANQVYMHGLNAFIGDTPTTNTDTWDGYFGERRELLETLHDQTQNLVVLSGDFHAASVGDLRTDPFDLDGPIVGTEFMAPAISSLFPAQLRPLAPVVLGLNPQVRHFEPDNGYMTCEVDDSTWRTTIHRLADVTDDNSPVATAGSFTVASGQPGVQTINIDS